VEHVSLLPDGIFHLSRYSPLLRVFDGRNAPICNAVKLSKMRYMYVSRGLTSLLVNPCSILALNMQHNTHIEDQGRNRAYYNNMLFVSHSASLVRQG